MKSRNSIVLLIVILIACFNTSAQSWCPKANYPGVGMRSGVGFSIGDKGYYCNGSNGLTNSAELWEYDTTTNSWTKKANFPGVGRRSGIAFVIGTDAYVGLGWNGSNVFSDMYKYNSLTDTWTTIASFPGQGTKGCIAAAVNGKGYVVAGSNSGTTTYNEFYEYDPIVDTWTLKTAFNMGKRLEGIGENLGNFLYLGLGHDYFNDFNDFWRYNPANNTWSVMAAFPGVARLNALSFVINGKIIAGGGYELFVGIELTDYYEYDPMMNTWTAIPTFNGAARSSSSTFANGQYGYVSGGWKLNNIRDTWRYGPPESKRRDTVLCEDEVWKINVYRAGAIYKWQDNSTSSIYTVSQPGVYYVDLNFGGCIRRDSFVVAYKPKPIVNLGNDTTFCSNKPFILNATVPNNATYLWNDNSVAPILSVDSTALYWVQVKGANGCYARDSIQVNYFQKPIVNLGKDIKVCEGENVSLDATFPAATYQWQNGSTNATFKPTQSGLYWVVVSKNGCSESDSINVLFTPKPIVDLGNDTILCDDSQLILDATLPNATYKWQNGAKSAFFPITEKGLYWVETTVDGCSMRDSIQIIYNYSPRLNLGTDKTICRGQVLELNAESYKSTYLWQDFSTLNKFDVNESGTYYVQATNFCGVDSDTIKIEVEKCECNVYMPNAFTPNGDGINDSYGSNFECEYEEFRLSIFNRWGELIFESSSQYQFWDGTYNGTEVPSGNYVYKLMYLDPFNGLHQYYSGTFVLIK